MICAVPWLKVNSNLSLFNAQVYPLIGIMGIAMAGVTAFCMYAMTKNDVV